MAKNLGNRALHIQQGFDIAMERIDSRRAMRAWVDQQRSARVDLSDDSVLLEKMAMMLSPLFEYIAVGKNPRGLGMRAWCILYAVRPELIQHETFQAAATRFGVTQEALIYHFARLKKAFPSFDYVSRTAPNAQVLKARMMKANAGRVAQQKAAKKQRTWANRNTAEAA